MVNQYYDFARHAASSKCAMKHVLRFSLGVYLIGILEPVTSADSSRSSSSPSSTPTSTSSWTSLLSHPFLTSCNIPVVDDLSLEDFQAQYKGKLPVIYRRPRHLTDPFRAITNKASLLESLSSEPILLASANSFSQKKKPSNLHDYIIRYMGIADPTRLANDTWYFFGDTAYEHQWQSPPSARKRDDRDDEEEVPPHPQQHVRGAEGFLEVYPLPLDTAENEGLRVWGLGGAYSGVSFHTHGAAHAEVIHGKKRWYLSSPRERPLFEGDKSQLQWVLEQQQQQRLLSYASTAIDVNSTSASTTGVNRDSSAHITNEGILLVQDTTKNNNTLTTKPSSSSSSSSSVLECTVGEEQILYIPSGWWHATLNLNEWNAFVSVFTLEHL